MRNLITKGIFIFLLVFNPIHLIKSYDAVGKNDVDAIKKLDKVFFLIERNNIENEIDRELTLFNDSLYTYKPKISKRNNKININFINTITCHALESEGLPSIAIAQAILETGYGRHNKLKNNLFGIKGRGIKSRTKEFVNGKYVRIRSEFQKFNTLDEAFDRHYEIISKYGYQSRDYKEWAYRIKECGYATAPNYDKVLISIIELYDLHRLDRIQELYKSLDSLRNI